MKKHLKTKLSTSLLEESGELDPLDNVEDVSNPYGKHLCTVAAEMFTNGVYFYIAEKEKIRFAKFIPSGELLENVKEAVNNSK